MYNGQAKWLQMPNLHPNNPFMKLVTANMWNIYYGSWKVQHFLSCNVYSWNLICHWADSPTLVDVHKLSLWPPWTVSPGQRWCVADSWIQNHHIMCSLTFYFWPEHTKEIPMWDGDNWGWDLSTYEIVSCVVRMIWLTNQLIIWCSQ